MANNTNKHFRPVVAKVFKQGRDGKGSVISAEDALNQNKIKFTGASFGANVSPDYVYCYLDADEVLMLAHLVLSGTFGKILPPKEPTSFPAGKQTYKVAGEYTAYKGSPHSDQYNGNPESRMIEIRAIAAIEVVKPAVAADLENGIEARPAVTKTTPMYSVSMWFGPGKLTKTGAVMPDVSRSQMVSQRMYLTAPEMLRLMLKLQMHIQAYYADHYRNRYDAKGEAVKGWQPDEFSSDKNAPRQDTGDQQYDDGVDVTIPDPDFEEPVEGVLDSSEDDTDLSI